jgi:hypothetical protein
MLQRRPYDPEFAHPELQRRPLDPQSRRGSIRPGEDPIRLVERGDDVAPICCR